MEQATEEEENFLTVYEVANRNDVEHLAAALKGAYGAVPEDHLNLALLRAAANGHFESLELILKYNPDINTTDGKGHTALMLATQSGCLKIVRCLLDAGCSVNCRNYCGKTALIMACETSNMAAMDLLLHYGADYRSHGNETDRYYPTLLTVAVEQQDVSLVRRVLDLGVDVNERSLASARTALHVAAGQRSSQMVDLLMKSGAHVDKTNGNGWSPLMEAVRYNRFDNVAALLRWGADVNQRDTSNLRTILHLMAATASAALIKMAIEAGANLNAVDDLGNVPLFDAIRHRNHAAFLALVQAGCDVDVACTWNFDTVRTVPLLFLVAWKADIYMMEILYQASACTSKMLQECAQCGMDILQQQTKETPRVVEKMQIYRSVPNTLAGLCRGVIRRAIRGPFSSIVQELDIPNYLKEFLQFCDVQFEA